MSTRLPNWILVVSGLFALMEIGVSASLWFAPESVLETVALDAQGVEQLVQMWATRQFALGVILGFAALKRSVPMLTVAYVFFLVMFVGDFVIGFLHRENSLMISAAVMCTVSASVLFAINRVRA